MSKWGGGIVKFIPLIHDETDLCLLIKIISQLQFSPKNVLFKQQSVET